MRNFSVFSCCFFFFFSAKANQDSIYQTLIAKANLFHLQENYESAIACYEQAFKIQNPDALTAYKAAGMCNLNYKQLYGTQVIWANHGKASGFRPIKEEDKVDVRRKEMGLQPLQIYALTYEFNYQIPTTAQVRQRDSAENVNLHLLIDSAKYFYSIKEFEKTYDYYNTASTFLGGMSSEDNLEAAILFSKIVAVDKDEKYKSIALDFLNLLYLREHLSKAQLLAQSAFQVLYKEQRWMDIIKQIK